MNIKNNKLIILSGPSGVGKSPLKKAVLKFFPVLKFNRLTLYNSRLPRPGEVDGVDYYFRTRDEIEKLKNNNSFIVLDVRGDLQALDLNEMEKLLEERDVFYEGNPFISLALIEHPSLSNVDKLTIFLSPLSADEIAMFKSGMISFSVKEVIVEVMRKKLLRRTLRQKGILSLKDIENIEKRAASAYEELKLGCKFQYVIPNHDGEDSENWEAFYYPIGDARKTMLAFVSLVNGKTTINGIEKWTKQLLE
ncbi:MAG: guanylate kinase [Limisphaerales bacterium]